MKKRRAKKYADSMDPVRELGLNTSDWQVYSSFGKSFLYNPTNARSYVGVQVTHLPTGREIKTEKKGNFTKTEARRKAFALIKDGIAQLLSSTTASLPKRKS